MEPKVTHIEWHERTGGITAVYCHGQCEDQLQGLVPSDKYHETFQIAGKTVVFQRLLLAYYPAYTELEIEMSDGSHHVMAACKNCAYSATLEDITNWYEEDIQAYLESDRRTGHDCNEAWLRARKPVKILKIIRPGTDEPDEYR